MKLLDAFIKLLDWAKRDNVCALAIALGVIGAFPQLLKALELFFQNALIPLALALGGN